MRCRARVESGACDHAANTAHTAHTAHTANARWPIPPGCAVRTGGVRLNAYASQAATQPVKVLTPSGRGSTIRCDGKQAKEAYLFPTLTNVPFPALVEGVAHTTNTQGGASVEQWDACTSALTATGLRAFYNGGMPQSDWQISPAFPYQGATPSACANADLCWKRADDSVTVYIALQNV